MKYSKFASIKRPDKSSPVSGFIGIYGVQVDGEQELVAQVFRDADGSVKVFSGAAYEEDCLKRITSFALSMTQAPFECFCEGLLSECGLYNGLYSEKQEFHPVFTDEEHRILLAAMAREEQICRKTDEEYDGGKQLTKIVDSIFHKIHVLQHGNI